MPSLPRTLLYHFASSPPPSSSRLPLTLLASRDSHKPFFDSATRPGMNSSIGKDDGEKAPVNPEEEEVDDQEWAMRVGSGILHLRATLPHIFSSNPPTNLFPPTVYSNSVSLSLPAPLPLKISSLPLYSFTFSLARHGMHALHTDLYSVLHKLHISQDPGSNCRSLSQAVRQYRAGPSGMNRNKQVRVMLEICGVPRLGVQHKESSWQTSSLYTFSPISGLINHHQVETIRPLPGESVGQWLSQRLWGWRALQSEGYYVGCETREGGAVVRSVCVEEVERVTRKKDM